uniref:Putative ovule protein n=1 Tax=Solanum chacoense TaxID=4108 RepID=A0A0V0ICZ1_SOLCH
MKANFACLLYMFSCLLLTFFLLFLKGLSLQCYSSSKEYSSDLVHLLWLLVCLEVDLNQCIFLCLMSLAPFVSKA